MGAKIIPLRRPKRMEYMTEMEELPDGSWTAVIKVKLWGVGLAGDKYNGEEFICFEASGITSQEMHRELASWHAMMAEQYT